MARVDAAAVPPRSETIDLGAYEGPEFLMVTHDAAGRAYVVHTSDEVMWLQKET